MSADSPSWYGVRCIFKLGDQPLYEERITVWRAQSFEEAVELAEADAEQYAATHGLDYLHLAQVFDQKSEIVGSGSEVFSLIRESPLTPDDYINRFIDTGSERQGTLE